MENIGQVAQTTISIFGHSISFNHITLIMTWVVMAILILICYLGTRRLSLIPNRVQSIFELLVEFLSDITISTLGERDGKKYLPLIMTLFIFILLSNYIGIIPNLFVFFGTIVALMHKAVGGAVNIVVEGFGKILVQPDPSVWYAWMLTMPAFEEPTRNINTDLGMAILVFILVHLYGIRNKGIVNYFKDYMDPVPAKMPYILFFWANPFFYLNIIGTISNTVSHAFRLFGNVFGGGMIIVIVSSLLHYMLVPIGLFAFFTLFSGLVQAFVFTMLAVTYIQQQQ